MKEYLTADYQKYVAPDSGGWSRVNSNWVETTNELYVDGVDFQVRKEGSFRVTVDGFPRQGNRYLRRKILLAFPEAAMPFPLCHKEVAFRGAIENDHFVFSTFRDPIDSMSSHLSGVGYQDISKKHNNTILDPLKYFIYTEDDYFYIKKCFLFYIRMTQFIINNINDIFVVPFGSIVNDTNNSLSIVISKVLPTTEYIDPDEVEPNSSKDLNLKQYLMTEKFKDITEQAYSVYNQVLKLSKTHSDRFIL
jgi:hypothetical protein